MLNGNKTYMRTMTSQTRPHDVRSTPRDRKPTAGPRHSKCCRTTNLHAARRASRRCPERRIPNYRTAYFPARSIWSPLKIHREDQITYLYYIIHNLYYIIPK